MHQRIIRIGLALMLLAVGVAPGFAAVIKCCCRPAEPAFEAKSCCANCTCEVKANEHPKGSPDFLWVPAELESSLIPLLPDLEETILDIESQLFLPAPIAQAHSPPERVLGRAPPLYCS